MSANVPLNIFTLPLFPLNHVQFPQVPLQLYVFEERYKAMINGCIERNEPFGVVLIREGMEVGSPATPFDVGCITRILAVKKEDDGRMFLLAAGEERFRLLDYMEADLPYLLGKVEIMEDAPESLLGLESLATTLQNTFAHYLTLLAEQAGETLPPVELPEDPILLTYYVASIANLSSEIKQSLLEKTDARERIQDELDLLREQISELEILRAGQPSDESESEQISGSHVILAMPIDPNDAAMRQYRQEGRN